MFTRGSYICGAQLTEADVRLFMTLVRFDEVYVVYFKCNVKRIADYPNILDYCRDLYQSPNFAECISMDHIKTHYFRSVDIAYQCLSSRKQIIDSRSVILILWQ